MHLFDIFNGAHVHLLLNHIPIIAVPTTLIFLLSGFILNNASIKRLSLLALMFLSLFSIVVFLTGEPAEEAIENLPFFAESFVETHETAAKISLGLVLLLGGLAGYAYNKEGRELSDNAHIKTVLFAGFLTVISLGYTANLGGQIRHTEVRSENK